MARTIQTLVDEVRRITVDRTTPYRYSDEDIAAELTTYFGHLQRQRPDAFTPYTDNFTLPEITPTSFSDPWPVSEQFFRPGVDYVVGYLELADDEHANSGRADMFLNRCNAALLGAA